MRKLIFILGLISTNLFAQSLEVEAKVDTNLGEIGEQIRFELHVQSNKDTKVTWPLIIDSLGKLEVLEAFPIDTHLKGEWKSYNQAFILTSFDSGYFKIPNLEIGLDTNKAFSNELVVRFNDVKTDPNKVMDIKEPISVPASYIKYIYWTLAVLAILGLIIWLYIKYFKNKSKEKQEEYIPLIPAHEEALDALTALHKDKIWERVNENKTFYTLLTHIIWRYLDRQFNVITFERTSDEIIKDLDRLMFAAHFKKELADLLRHADFIKFAKGSSTPYDNEQHIEQSIKFVKATIPSPVKVEDE